VLSQFHSKCTYATRNRKRNRCKKHKILNNSTIINDKLISYTVFLFILRYLHCYLNIPSLPTYGTRLSDTKFVWFVIGAQPRFRCCIVWLLARQQPQVPWLEVVM